MDRIEIRDLLVRTLVGINPEEQQKRQDVLMNLTLFVDLRRAGETDDVADAVNYRTVTKRVVELVEGGSFALVEKLAAVVAATCLEFDGVERVRVKVEKPGALRFARSVGVVIERDRG